MSIVHYHDLGTMKVLLDRLNNQRLPIALRMKSKVDRGDTLSDIELDFLQHVFDEARHARSLFLRHPETYPLVIKLIGLYSHIIEKDLENERARQAQAIPIP